MSSSRSTWLRRARFALLLAPAAMLAGCYVVPVVPAGRPYYRYPGPPPGPYYRGYYRGYYGMTESGTQAAGASDMPPLTEIASAAR